MVNETIESLRAQLAEARAEVEAWRGRFKALVGEDRPDMAGNALLHLRAGVARLTRALRGSEDERREQERHAENNAHHFVQAEARLAEVAEALENLLDGDSALRPAEWAALRQQAVKALGSRDATAKEKPKA